MSNCTVTPLTSKTIVNGPYADWMAIVSVRALREIHELLPPESTWREHVTPWIYTHPYDFKQEVFPVTIDTQSDYDKLRP